MKELIILFTFKYSKLLKFAINMLFMEHKVNSQCGQVFNLMKTFKSGSILVPIKSTLDKSSAISLIALLIWGCIGADKSNISSKLWSTLILKLSYQTQFNIMVTTKKWVLSAKTVRFLRHRLLLLVFNCPADQVKHARIIWLKLRLEV